MCSKKFDKDNFLNTMSFDYEQSIWGKGKASLAWSSPTAFRLRQALRAVQNLPSGAMVVEVGCGVGQFIRAVKKQLPTLRCCGSDISATAIALAVNEHDGVEYSHHAPERLPYADGSTDAVLIFDVLEHVPDPAALLREVRRVLKPNGILYAFVPCEGDWLSFWHLLDILHLKRELTKKFAGHIQYFSRRALLDLFRRESFDFKRVRYSEHVVGQLLGVVAFWLMDRGARRSGLTQINNEQYLGAFAGGTVGTLLKRIINTWVYIESTVLSRVPSPNVHVTAVKH